MKKGRWHTHYIDHHKKPDEVYDIIEKHLGTYKNLHKVIDSEFYVHDKDTYQFITKLLRSNSKIEHTFFSLLYRAVFQSETLSAKSASFCYVFALLLWLELERNKASLHESKKYPHEQQFNDFCSLVKLYCESNSQNATMEDIETTIESICESDKELSCAIKEAVKAAGIEGKIFVEEGAQPHYVVEAKNGFTFGLEPFSMFFEHIGTVWDRSDVKILLIDGLVEQVSEIDQILSKAYETKQPTIIVAHGFSEEVVATCMKNFQLGNIDVMPVRTKRDVSSVNIINDISVTTNSQPVSHLVGNMISMVSWEDLQAVDRVICSPQTTTFVSKKTPPGINSHVKSLVSKRYSQDFEEFRNIIDERLRSLVAHSVIIRLPSQSTATQNNRSKLIVDQCLRQIKTSINYGTINTKDFVHSIDSMMPTESSEFMRKILKASMIEAINSLGSDTIPALSLLSAITLSGKTTLMFYNSSGIVTRD